jgi:enoyl-CoA hydratase
MLFAGDGLRDILNLLRPAGTGFATATLEAMARNSPLSMACTVDLIRRVRGRDTIEGALELEYRFTARAMEHGDFLEGIRAAIIDKDRSPNWRHATRRGRATSMSRACCCLWAPRV